MILLLDRSKVNYRINSQIILSFGLLTLLSSAVPRWTSSSLSGWATACSTSPCWTLCCMRGTSGWPLAVSCSPTRPPSGSPPSRTGSTRWGDPNVLAVFIKYQVSGFNRAVDSAFILCGSVSSCIFTAGPDPFKKKKLENYLEDFAL